MSIHMQSLRDKLLKAGLVSKEQVEKAEQKKEESARPAQTKERRPKPENRGPVPKLPPLPGSPEYQRLEAKKQVALDRKIRELVLAAQVGLEHGTRTFYFVTRKSRLRRLELSESQAGRLEQGELAVVERPDPDKIEHALVPSDIASAILKLSPKAVRYLNSKESPVGFMTEDELAKHEPEESDQPDVEPTR
jgi:uncharacterized protein YaiL (DUF2058 family)